jgi:hypothetical protein
VTDVWIRTEPTADDSGYIVTLSVGEDSIVHLTPERALEYARTLLGHIMRARHDAAIARQLKKRLGMDRKATSMHDVAMFIRDLRADRPPLDDSATQPLTFEPGVNQSSKGFITVSHQGTALGTWSLKAAKNHAMGILEAVEGANLDAAYVRMLVGTIGLERHIALNVVDDLGKYMENT